MRRICLLIGTALLSTSLAAATDWSTMEMFLGYHFVRFNPNSGYIPSFNANGGGGQFVYNFTKYFGVAADIGAVTRGTLNQAPWDTTVLSFVAGPRFTYQNHSHFIPFAQVLFGGAYATTSAPVTLGPGTQVMGLAPNAPVSVRVTAANTGFAMLAGGGLDIKVSKHVCIRPVEAEYFLARATSILTGNTTNRNNFRYSAGVNFLFGKR